MFHSAVKLGLLIEVLQKQLAEQAWNIYQLADETNERQRRDIRALIEYGSKLIRAPENE